MFKFLKTCLPVGRKQKKPENIQDVLEKLNKLEQAHQELVSKLNSSVRKIGIVRFNPFKEIGGEQSFSIALMNGDNNGFVITSHYGKESNRVYAKPIGAGKSSYSLSAEEEKAIRKAIEGD